jgi:hypothetical protein
MIPISTQYAEYAAFLAADAIRWTDGKASRLGLYLTSIPVDRKDEVPYERFIRLMGHAVTSLDLIQFQSI